MLLGHLGQNVIGRPVDNPLHLSNLVSGKTVGNRPQNRDPPGHTGFVQEVTVIGARQLNQFGPFRGNQILIGRHHMLMGG